MRKNIVAGNWKMNNDLTEAHQLTAQLVEKMKSNTPNCEIIIAPSYPFLESIYRQIKETKICLAAQNCNENEQGAFTGEVSAKMIKSIGVKYVIIGHSERRMYFNENNHLLASKINIALHNQLIPIFCCGEPLEIRESETQNSYVCNQIEESLFQLNEQDFSQIIIAYEPIWAIGTGKTASSQQAQDMHKTIRDFVAQKYGSKIASNLSILYGGSCKPSNALELFSNPDVDGGLIGGAALSAEDFFEIINAI